jgi:hypothetical protein
MEKAKKYLKNSVLVKYESLIKGVEDTESYNGEFYRGETYRNSDIFNAIQIAYLEGIIAISSQRFTDVENYSFKDWCASQEAGARKHLKGFFKEELKKITAYETKGLKNINPDQVKKDGGYAVFGNIMIPLSDFKHDNMADYLRMEKEFSELPPCTAFPTGTLGESFDKGGLLEIPKSKFQRHYTFTDGKDKWTIHTKNYSTLTSVWKYQCTNHHNVSDPKEKFFTEKEIEEFV